MPVHIDEVTTNVRVVDPDALLSPAVLERIVAAVLKQLQAEEAQRRHRESERDLSSVVERQRARGW